MQVPMGNRNTLWVLLTVVVSFWVGVILARIVPDGDPRTLVEITIAAIGAFAGTAAGAWIALYGDRRKREQELEDLHVEAANIAIFNLGQIYTYVYSYNRQIVEPKKSSPRRWWDISRSVLQAPLLQPFDVSRLAFLFESDHRDLPNRLAIEFQRFQGFLDIVRRASELNDQVQSSARANQKDPDAIGIVDEFCNAATKETLEGQTNTIIEHCELLIPSVIEAAMALQRALKSRYPHRTIVWFAPTLQPIK